jgi:multidrug resistance efflux pump
MSLREEMTTSRPRAVLKSAAPSASPGLQSKPLRPGDSPARRISFRKYALVLTGVAFVFGMALYNAGLDIRQSAAGDVTDQRPTTIAAPGLVESVTGMLHLAFEIPGKLKCVNAIEGQIVTKGQVLADLVNDDQVARLSMAEAELSVVESEFQTLESNLKADEIQLAREVERYAAEYSMMKAGPRQEVLDHARAMVKAAEIESERRARDAKRYLDPVGSSDQARDMSQGQALIADAQLHAARAKLKELEVGFRTEEITKARVLYESAKANLERVRQTCPHQLSTARARIEQAIAKKALAAAELVKTRLLAPMDGIVVWKFRHSGESVSAVTPEPVVTIADTRALRVRADVDESDFARIKPGMRVRVRADAFGTQDFPGRVETIGAVAGQKRFSTGEARERHDVKVIETLVTFDVSPPFKPGLRVTAYFEKE